MKRFVLFLTWMLFVIVSCEKPSEKEETPSPSGLGGIEGFLCFKSQPNPLGGYIINIGGKTATTNYLGYFLITGIPEGVQKIEVWLGTTLVYESSSNVVSDVTIPILITISYKKGNLPDEIVVIDISSHFSEWNFMVRGKDKQGNEECFFLDEENSLAKRVSFYQFAKDEFYQIEFYDTGLPKRVKAGEYIFMFGNFEGNKFDFGVLYPSGEIEVVRDIEAVWPTPSKGNASKAEIIRWTGRILGAVPCIIYGTASFFTMGAALPIALWTCGNYLLSMADKFFEDADVENGFTQFVDDYHLLGTQYGCLNSPDPVSCLISFAQMGLETYADYIEEVELRENDVLRLEQLIEEDVPLKAFVFQPGPEGKYAWISMGSYDDCRPFYDRSSNDSLISVMYDAKTGSCSKQVERMLLYIPFSGIPSDAVISSAELEVYGEASINIKEEIPTLDINFLKGFWTEEVTWPTLPETEKIGSTDFVNKSIRSQYSFDITNFVQEVVSGRKENFGFLILTAENTVYSKICSGDHPNSNLWPRIRVLYY